MLFVYGAVSTRRSLQPSHFACLQPPADDRLQGQVEKKHVTLQFPSILKLDAEEEEE